MHFALEYSDFFMVGCLGSVERADLTRLLVDGRVQRERRNYARAER
jgi:hypothetical protein